MASPVSIAMLLYTLFMLFTFGCSLSVIPGTGYLPAIVRAACRSALSETIAACSDELQYPEEWIPSTSLKDICTTGCQAGLDSMYSKALSACGTGSVNITTNVTSEILVPINLAAELVYRYNITCLQGDGGFCKEKLQNMTAEKLCSDCYMKKTVLEIDEPMDTSDPYSPEEFNSLKQSCGIPTTSYPIKPTTPAGTPPPIPTCTTKITAKAGDTTNSIAKSNSVSTDRLLVGNSDLPPIINDTLAGGEIICLDNVPKCMIRQVVAGDTCESLITASGKGVDIMMFRSWNPSVGRDCKNLPSMVGKYVCVSPPGTATPFKPVEGTPKPTITTISTPEPTHSWGTVPNTMTSSMNMTTTWIFPTDPLGIITATATPPPNAAISSMLARVSHCPFLKENSDEWTKDLAPDEYHLHSWDLSEECIESWDPYCFPAPTGPILPSPTNIASSCYPTISTVIPDGGIPAPGPIQTGVPDNCNKWHVVKTGDTCSTLESKYKINHTLFRQYNPVINDACSNLIVDFAYCVRIWVEPSTTLSPTATSLSTRTSVVSTTSMSSGPPGPTQSGTSPTCTKWHIDKQGDTCDSIAAQYNIIVSRFRQLNRSVNAACSNLVVGNAYCVG